MCFELRSGQQIRIRGSVYRILQADRRAPGVTLCSDDECQTELRTSRAELQALVVLGDAELIDELEDPDRRPTEYLVNLSFLSPHRLHDWQLKVILLRAMLLVRTRSFKSSAFRRAYQDACDLVDACRELSPITGGKQWSMYEIYHTLLRWRASGYAYTAIQNKGIAFRKPLRHSKLHKSAREVSSSIAKKDPALSMSTVHRKTNERLSAVLSLELEETE